MYACGFSKSLKVLTACHSQQQEKLKGPIPSLKKLR